MELVRLLIGIAQDTKALAAELCLLAIIMQHALKEAWLRCVHMRYLIGHYLITFLFKNTIEIWLSNSKLPTNYTYSMGRCYNMKWASMFKIDS